MSAEAKKKESVANGAIDLSATYSITYSIELPNPSSRRNKMGQPCWPSGGGYTSVAHLLGQHKMTHLEALQLYQDACKREEAARKMREFWGEVVTNWHTHTEKVEDSGG